MARNRRISIHQFHSGSALADAVTNSMFFVRSMLRGLGFASDIYAEHVAPELMLEIAPLNQLRLEKDDILLIHHSMGHDALPRLAALPGRKFLIYHNITPPELFADSDSVSRAYAVKGYAELSRLRELVEAAVAVSPYNERQLRSRGFDDVAVIPLLKDFAALRQAPHRRWPYYDDDAVFRILFVGRVVPHKCQHELIDFVRQVRAIGGSPVRLVLVGHADNGDPYRSRLDDIIERKGLAEHVRLTGRVSDDELFGWYRAANAFVSLSEHEGFGVPLIEAMAFDLPVVAYPSGAVQETLGDAGVALADKRPATVAEALTRLREDRPYRRAVIKAQRRRLLRFSREAIESELRRWLARIGAIESIEAPSAASVRDSDAPVRPQRTHYVVEGPWETSYSLALVNRNIALALDERAGSSSSIEPADGTEDYSVDPVAACLQPDAIQRLVGPAPVTPERIVTIRNTYPPRPNGMLGDLRLLHLAWEESAIPGAVARMINLHADGVVVPSRYVKQVIRNSGVRLPIAVIGHGIDHAGILPRVLGGRDARPPISEAVPYTFLHVSSGLARKGIEELITAYCLAFSAADPVLLVIKTFDNPTNVVADWVEQLAGQSPRAPAIQIVSEDLDPRRMDFLYQVADAVLLPTRGEGFNLPAAEGMARGVPAIVTRHGGHLDFCNDANAFLIDCRYELSQSHLHIADSYWARPLIPSLAETLKELFRQGRSHRGAVSDRAARARDDALRLRWRDVGEKIERFATYLENRPIMNRKLRLGWVSTFNTRCGIAEYSAHLLAYFDRNIFDITILADRQEPIAPTADNAERLWKMGEGTLAPVTKFATENALDAVVFQYNAGFFEVDVLAESLSELAEAGIHAFVVFHRTSKLVDDDRPGVHALIRALKDCAGIFVHSIADVERLRQRGVTDNVVLLAHGVIDRQEIPTDAVRALLGLAECKPVIGTFGFLLPGKGLPELIHAFALLHRAFPSAYLLLINAEYPVAESREQLEYCEALIRLLDLGEHVRLIKDFLDVEDALLLLNACDAIVFPYQRSEESASGALRQGLAAGPPVLTTPIPIFADVAGVVHPLPGLEPSAIADGIISLLNDPGEMAAVRQRQREWVHAHSWAAQAARLSNIIIGCCEEAQGAELQVPTSEGADASESAHTSAAGPQTDPRMNWPSGDADTDAFALRVPGAAGAKTGRPRPHARLLRLLRRPDKAKNGSPSTLSLADAARDAREWSTAAQYYQEVLYETPENSPIWVQYGHALKEMGHLPEAEEAYRTSLELAGDVGDTHLQLGHVLKLQGKNVEAGFAYLQALMLDPALEENASSELHHLGWTRGRIELALRRERMVVGAR